jgi:maltooligosyltrehalose trehalohydrolase
VSDPIFGAVPVQDGVRFAVWAPEGKTLELTLIDGAAAGTHPLAASGRGLRETWVRGAAAGDHYTYRLDGEGPYPDPASRFQPEGVHGPSRIVDPGAFTWHDSAWRPRPARDLVIYELHVGTFTPEGTFAGVEQRLPYVRDLGITAIELMPVADFAGSRNWGYDGVALFAPARAYGTPDDLRRLVDAAHRHGLSVILDIVYNHLGPEGAYLPTFNPSYLTDRHRTPWGDAVNLDGDGSPMVRSFILDNAAHWVREYHIDGLRLDATHALIDDGPRHVVQDIAERVRAVAGRPIFVHAEDHRNLASMIDDPANGGWGLDAVWADDFHHVVRAMVAGDTHGYYADFAGHTRELATVVQDGWLYSGAYSAHAKRARGTSAAGIPMHRFVVCVQNHDQVGNRAFGNRLHHEITPEAWRAVSVLLLTVPMTPLLLMGQEWAVSSPFQFFTDLGADLGPLVTAGRRQEFADFPEFSNLDSLKEIPDPQALRTFEASRLRWEEQAGGEHARSLALYRALLALRRDHPALSGSDRTAGAAVSPDDQSLVMRRSDEGETFWVVLRFTSSGTVDLESASAALGSPVEADRLTVVLDTEHGEFAEGPLAIDIDRQTVTFARPGAVILQER